MDCLKCLLFFTIFTNYALAELQHSNETHDDAFDSILTNLGSNDTLRLQDVNSVLTKLGANDCSSSTKHKCVTAESLFQIFNISNASSVDEQNFAKFAPIILYALLPEQEHSHEASKVNAHDDDDHGHDNDENHGHDDDDDGHDDKDSDKDEHSDDDDSDKKITGNIDVYKELMERYETSELCEQIFDQLLKDLNGTTGELLNGKKCFSSHEIFHDVNISSASDAADLSELSVVIISRLLQKQCIEVSYQSPLPCPSYFANQLFHKYAHNDVLREEEMDKLLKELKIGSRDGDHDEKETTNEHDHDHRRRRSLDVSNKPQMIGKPLGLKRYRREAIDDDHANESQRYQKCYTVDDYFAIYQVDHNTGFKLEKFQQLGSALVQQVESKVCSASPHADESSSGVATKHKWGYGILAVAIVSLCSVFGVAIIPFMQKLFYQKIIVYFISLAVGTLVGDALLHLLPHALGLHSSDSHDHGSESSDHSEDRDYLWKFLVATSAVYAFFLFETLTHLFLRKEIGHSHSVEQDNVRDVTKMAPEPNQDGKTPVALINMAYVSEENQTANTGKTAATNGKEKSALDENGPDHNNHHHRSDTEEKGKGKKQISSVAWNIIIGDTIHNIADGIAIGVAFSGSISVGVSTTIAVFCHEFPHELGDFAVLLTAGMSVKAALLANFISACFCFLGLVFGILISEIEDGNLWIFAATAGFFIYIALTNMLPELLRDGAFSDISKASRFLLQNLGILTGFAIMFLLAYYEEDIDV